MKPENLPYPWEKQECAWSDVYTRHGEWISVSPSRAEFRTWRRPHSFHAPTFADLAAVQYSDAYTIAEHCGILDESLSLQDFAAGGWTEFGDPRDPYRWSRGKEWLWIEVCESTSTIHYGRPGVPRADYKLWKPGLPEALRHLSTMKLGAKAMPDGSERIIRGREWILTGVVP